MDSLEQHKQRNFNSNVGREDIFERSTGKERLHEISNDNGIRVVKPPISKNFVKSTTFPHHNIHKFTCMSPDGK
jgi:hypothetical protein